MLAIIHGWSDYSKSFHRLAKRLAQENPDTPIAHIRMGDYVSMDDRVTFDDLAQALESAWRDTSNGLSTQPRSTDLIVHSTGALVVRDWMTQFYTPDTNPIHRLVMLAGANFGSHLAHKGRSFAGRVLKGFNKKNTDLIKSGPHFQSGEIILDGLEIASTYSHDLALRDRFVDDPWYGPGRVLCTSIVGSTGYTNIAAAANEPGSDGTVRVSTANLNPVHITLDFETNPREPTLTLEEPNGTTAFARINRENHSTVALKKSGPRDAHTLEVIKKALRVTDAEFDGFTAELEAENNARREAGSNNTNTQPYQNTVVRLRDQYGTPVDDYFLELFAKKQIQEDIPDEDLKVDATNTRYLQEKVVSNVHAYRADPSSRSFMINTQRLFNKFGAEQNRPLYIALTAMPDIDETGTVGYRTIEYHDIGSVRVDPDNLAAIFAPDRTAFVSIRIRREQNPRLFAFSEMPT